MKDPWGRVESQAWPSDKPVWTRSVCWISAAVVRAALWLQYQTWTPLQRYWLVTYLSARISPILHAPVSTYRLMLVLHPDGTTYLPREDEVESGSTNTSDGLSIPFALSEEARQQKKKLLLTPARPWKNALVSDTLRAVVYRGQTPTDWAERPLLWGAAALSLGLAVAIPKDRENLRISQEARKLLREACCASVSVRSRPRFRMPSDLPTSGRNPIPTLPRSPLPSVITSKAA